jgi:hypothetical protein
MTRRLKHLTPRYVYSRVKWEIDQRVRPNEPWLTRDSINILQQILKPTDCGVEFGSGRSTRWFALRMAKLTSVENNQTWFQKVSLDTSDIKNLDYRLIEVGGQDGDGGGERYAGVLKDFADQSLDFVLVDGAYRSHCASAALSKIKTGGVMVIDNVNWFLPSNSRSPNSRSEGQGPIDDMWTTVYKSLSSWRKIWTSSNVSDTAIFFKT